MKKLLALLLIAFIILILILLINTLRMSSRQYALAGGEKIALSDSSILRLAEAVKFRTVSYDTSRYIDSTAFQNLLYFLDNSYPLCHKNLQKETINALSRVYFWKGKNSALKPVILLAHLDVVPPEGEWKEDPFGGIIKDGFIWGRGTLDDKVSVLGILEAAEKLLSEGFTPERSLYFAFGHDEEVGGIKGAKKIAEWMQEKNIEAEFILDEGLVIADGIVPGLEKPVALIGIAEKGYMTMELTVNLHGGHSSMPEKETAIGVLSSAIHRLEKTKPDAKLTEPAEKFLDHIGPEMGFDKKIIFSNRWLFEKLIIKTYEKTPSGNALIRTTISPTIFSAGVKENVLPSSARAIINLRILPGEEKGQLFQMIKEAIDDERVQLEVQSYTPPSMVSSGESFGYKKTDSTIRKIFPDILVAPSLMIAATDSKHYFRISENIYRFLPILFKKEDLERIHGKDERISVEGYRDVIRFYYELMTGM
jgi:carboxypeptidase PM20D1